MGTDKELGGGEADEWISQESNSTLLPGSWLLGEEECILLWRGQGDGGEGEGIL